MNKKSYLFALWTSVIIAFTSTGFAVLGTYLFMDQTLSFFATIWCWGMVFICSFIITQYRLEKLIFQRIKKIYDSVKILDTADFHKTSITSDIESLSAEVQKFAETKQQQIQNLTEKENYRREFLGNVSHELKTPLFTVQGYLLTLTDGAMNDKNIREKYLKRANKGVERLLAVVKDLDLISKLETDDLHLNKEPFNILELIHNSFELLEMKAKKRNISLQLDRSYEYPIMAIGDVERIEQVLTNLIVNSIKYGKKGGLTLVRISSHSPGKINVQIKDNGEGISKNHHSRLFERFYRVDKSRSREQGGSGLGLAIVKHIIEAHDEQISVESTLHKGATFSFTLEKFVSI